MADNNCNPWETTPEYTIELNEQGPPGKDGKQGEDGFSPTITVNTQNEQQYILAIQNKTGTFLTPNLYGSKEWAERDLGNVTQPIEVYETQYDPTNENQRVTYGFTLGCSDVAFVNGDLNITYTGIMESRVEKRDPKTNIWITTGYQSFPLYLRPAKVDEAGVVKPDGTTITVTEDGTISVDTDKFVTTDTTQTISGEKTFTAPSGINIDTTLHLGSSTASADGLTINSVGDQGFIRYRKTDGSYAELTNYSDGLYYDNVRLANTTDLAAKQDTLTAGTGITISDTNVISTTGSGGTSDYTDLTNKPQINSIELSGNKTGNDLGLVVTGNTQQSIQGWKQFSDLHAEGLSSIQQSSPYISINSTATIITVGHDINTNGADLELTSQAGKLYTRRLVDGTSTRYNLIDSGNIGDYIGSAAKIQELEEDIAALQTRIQALENNINGGNA